MNFSDFKASRPRRTSPALLASVVFACMAATASAAHARDHYLIISGGGTPSANNYSQYLQTRTLTRYLRKHRDPERVDVFFGAGNHERMSNPSSDVHVIRNRDGVRYNEFIPGVIRGNRAAAKNGIRAWFASDAPRRPGREDVLFLFVSDHGIPNRGDSSYQNNCILLWYHGARRPWSYRCLSVRELRALLGELPVKKTVFAMSQCYSGGFHGMSVHRRDGYPAANPRVCGFTSTTPDRIASGCTPYVDGPGYQGYERYFTEQLTGVNVVTGKGDFTPAPSIREAHRRATLLDLTLDIPLSTTDYYLQVWGRTMLSEGFRSRVPGVNMSKTRKLMWAAASLELPPDKLYSMAGKLSSAARTRYAFMQRMVRAIAARDPARATLLHSGTQHDLTVEVNRLLARARELSNARNRLDGRRGTLRRNRFFQDWRDALEQGQVGLTEESIAFEKQVFARFESRHGRRSNFEGRMRYMFLYRLLRVTRRDRALARRFSIYYNSRDRGMYAWALGTNDPELGRTARELQGFDRRISEYDEKIWDLKEKAGLTRRVLLMRLQFGALIALGNMGDAKALEDLRGLEKCESTPYAGPSRVSTTPGR